MASEAPRAAPTTSLRRRLFAWLLVPVALLSIVSSGAAYYTAFRFANDVYDREISDAAIALSQLSRFDGVRTIVDLPAAAQHMLASDQRDRIYYRVTDAEGRFIAGHRALPSPPDTPRAGAEASCYDGVFNGDPVRVAVYRPAGVPVIVQVAETVTKRDMLALEIIAGMLVPLAALILLAGASVWLGVERGLRPLTQLADQLRDRSAQDLRALDESTAPLEVRPVVAALNGLLARVDAMLTTQQRFVADAAHQLRTPIAGLKTQAEMALRTSDPQSLRATLGNIVAAAARMGSLVGQLLALARAEPDAQRRHERSLLDLGQLARTVTADWIPRALEAGVDLGFESEDRPLPIHGDAVMLRELIGNLVDNTLKYCPRGSEVTVGVVADGSGAQLTVTDDGPGIPAAERERVFERFHRLADSSIPGNGLGLAIVREIATAHGGSAAVESGPGGRGIRVVVRVPGHASTDRRQATGDRR
jgi:two-component system sensor histidine kinase TctE